MQKKKKKEESNTMEKTRDDYKKLSESKGTFHVMMGTKRAETVCP